MPSPRLRRLSVEDYQEAPEWFQRFVEQMNTFVTDTGVAFDQILDANRSRQVEENVVFTTDGSGLVTNLKIKNRLPQKPKNVEIGQIRPTSVSASTALTVGKPVWKLVSGETIQIDHIGGLGNSVEYRATFVIT